MQTKLPAILTKIALIALEILFVGLIGYFRMQNIGWIFIIFGLALLLWDLIHLGLLTTFIITLKPRPLDILLYLAVHFFYLWGWLLQSDGGDSDYISWTIQQFYSSTPFTAFLKQNGDTLCLYAIGATLLCYLIITILVITRLVKYLQSRRTNPAPTPATP